MNICKLLTLPVRVLFCVGSRASEATTTIKMFIKPFKIKSNILVTGSEKKRLRQRVLAQFNRSDSDTALVELFGNRTKVCTVKIVTYHEEPVTLYTSDKRPIFFELNGKLLPTVYTLWACPDLVPAFTTHPTVLPKLANGADLMIPGVVKQGTNLASWGRHQKDDVVAVNLTSNRAAVGVGLLAHSSSDLYMCGGHGVCVRVMHVFGDKLWGMEPSVCQQVPILGTVVSVPKDSDFPPLVAESTKKVEEPVKEVHLSPACLYFIVTKSKSLTHSFSSHKRWTMRTSTTKPRIAIAIQRNQRTMAEMGNRHRWKRTNRRVPMS